MSHPPLQRRSHPGRARPGTLALVLAVALLALVCSGCARPSGALSPPASKPIGATTPATAAIPPSPSTAPGTSLPPGTSTVPTTAPAAPGFVPGRITAIGDSVMLDYGPSLVADVPGVVLDANVGEQWYEGLDQITALHRSGTLGAVVVIGLGTNGPITASDVAQMMAILSGASRVVLVTIHVDQPWQSAVNAVLHAAAAHYPNVVLADWASVAATHADWFYSDGTHLPIGGPGARALAAIVAAAITEK